MFSTLNLRAILVTDARQSHGFTDYLALRATTSVCAVILIAGFAFAAGYRSELLVVTVLIGMGQAVESLSDICYGLLQRRERMKSIALSMMSRGLLSALALGVTYYLTSSIVWASAGLMLARGSVLLMYDYRKARVLEPGFHCAAEPSTTSSMLKLIRLSLPLGIVLMLNSFTTNAPRYVIERYLGVRDVGVFAVLASFMMVGLMITNALGQATTPRLARDFASGDLYSFRSLLLKLLALGAVVGVAGVVTAFGAGRWFLGALFGSAYVQYESLLVGMLTAGILLYLAGLLGYGLTAARSFQVQVPVCASVAVTAVLASILLVRAYALWGAVFGVGLAGLLHCVILAFLLRSVVRRARAARDPRPQ
jgi:O-antigen/teichoic acid export membrane protein